MIWVRIDIYVYYTLLEYEFIQNNLDYFYNLLHLLCKIFGYHLNNDNIGYEIKIQQNNLNFIVAISI
jgi:hypothetical protein